MDLIIKDLKEDYPLVYEAALSNQEAEGNKRDDALRITAGLLDGNFQWNTSKEGWGFWDAIDERNFIKAKNIHPHLFGKTTKE